MSIRDTSGQDRSMAGLPQTRRRKHWPIAAASALAALLAAAWLPSGWSAGRRSFAGARVRMAAVTRGDLRHFRRGPGDRRQRPDPVRDRSRHGDRHC